MWDRIESFLGRPETHDPDRFLMNFKVFAFSLVATAVTEQLRHQLLLHDWAAPIGLASGILVQQAIPPRASLAKFLLLLLLSVPIGYIPNVIKMIARAW